MSPGPAEGPEEVQAVWLSTTVTRTMGGYGVHVFRAGELLIDSGFPHASKAFLGWSGLEGAGACLLTHHHEDHVGNAAALVERGIGVRAPTPVVRSLEDPPKLLAYQRMMWGTPEPVTVTAVDGATVAGDWRLVPIATPGHAPDHYVYHEPERDLVFTGDLYLGRRVEDVRRGEELGPLLESLRRVRDLRPRALYCAHRGRVDRPAEALQAKIDWLEDVIAKARKLGDGGASVDEIRRRLLGREGLTYWITAGDVCKRNLIEAALQIR